MGRKEKIQRNKDRKKVNKKVRGTETHKKKYKGKYARITRRQRLKTGNKRRKKNRK